MAFFKLILELIKDAVIAVEETIALLMIAFIILFLIVWKIFKNKK